jgi:hypothetical protein
MSLQVVVIPGPRGIAPRVDAFTARFWSALAQGQFLTTRCSDCARIAFPPRRFCPGCGATEAAWIELSGRGMLYSATVIHAGPGSYWAGGPYSVGVVDLAEGPRLVTRILGAIPPPIGSALRLVLTRHDDGVLFAAVAETDAS